MTCAARFSRTVRASMSTDNASGPAAFKAREKAWSRETREPPGMLEGTPEPAGTPPSICWIRSTWASTLSTSRASACSVRPAASRTAGLCCSNAIWSSDTCVCATDSVSRLTMPFRRNACCCTSSSESRPALPFGAPARTSLEGPRSTPREPDTDAPSDMRIPVCAGSSARR